jgi:hypothetical protein
MALHYDDDDDDDLMDSKSSLRFIYMDDEGLLSPTSSLHDSMSVESAGHWSQDRSHHHLLSPPLSPTSGEADQQRGSRVNRKQNNNSCCPSSHGHDGKTGNRKSIRKSLSLALTSPVRAAKGKISLSPRKATRPTLFHSVGGSHQNNHKEWRKQLHLPRDVVTQDEAIVFLLAKELRMLDF